MGVGTVLAAFAAGVMVTLALQAWRQKALGTTTTGPVVQALASVLGSPLVSDVASWAESTAVQGSHAALDAAIAAFTAKKAALPPATASPKT